MRGIRVTCGTPILTVGWRHTLESRYPTAQIMSDGLCLYGQRRPRIALRVLPTVRSQLTINNHRISARNGILNVERQTTVSAHLHPRGGKILPPAILAVKIPARACHTKHTARHLALAFPKHLGIGTHISGHRHCRLLDHGIPFIPSDRLTRAGIATNPRLRNACRCEAPPAPAPVRPGNAMRITTPTCRGR